MRCWQSQITNPVVETTATTAGEVVKSAEKVLDAIPKDYKHHSQCRLAKDAKAYLDAQDDWDNGLRFGTAEYDKEEVQ